MQKVKPLIVEKAQARKSTTEIIVTADSLKQASDNAKKDYQWQTKSKQFYKIIEMD